jgi:hypothetical protein
MDVLSQTFLYDRILAGVDVHPSQPELMEFERLSKIIDPQSEFSFRGCQPCVNEMIRFVFENKNKLDGKTSKKTSGTKADQVNQGE